MADTSQQSSIWDYVGPAVQAGAGVAGALGGASAASGGYNTAAGTIGNAISTSGAALAPYQQVGSGAAGALANLYGLGGQAPNFDAFTNSPGYQFEQQQGENAINRGAAASGNAFSTTTLAQLGNYNQGLASTQYQNYIQGLYGLTQTGAGAATAMGSQAITGATAQGNAQVGSGNANASGIAGAAGAAANLAGKLPLGQIASGIGSLFGSSSNGGNSNVTAATPGGYSYNGPTIYGSGSDPTVSTGDSGTTTYYGDDSGTTYYGDSSGP